MQTLNLEIYSYLNANTGLHGLPLFFSLFCAQYLILSVPCYFLVAWFWGKSQIRCSILVAFLAVIISLLINYIIGLLWYSPRPFVLGIGHTYFVHAADSSFPSDHATILFTLSLSLLLSKLLRSAGLIFLIIAIIVAWARIYLGVHYPLDMLGALVVAAVAVAIAYACRTVIQAYVLPKVELLYQKIFYKLIQWQWVRE
jgi:undecaprenyl-diphosphatase